MTGNRSIAFQIPILCYHANNISGNEYGNNDHVALGADLRLIDSLGLKIIPLDWIAGALAGENAERRLQNAVALSFDDGTALDFYDVSHPDYGWQRSFYFLMYEFLSEIDKQSQPYLHATCFVIASPEARAEMDIACFAGNGWMSDDWWPHAGQSNLLTIENHSWDHNHEAVDKTCQSENRKGDFTFIDTYEECDAEIHQASDFIETKTGRRPTLFAYPYGQASDYLRDEYLPRFQHEHGLRGAFSTEPEYVTRHTSLWWIPRFVCGRDWRSPEELRKLLKPAVV